MEKGFDFVAHGGRYVLVSVVKEPITFTDPDFHRKEMTLFGSRNATTEDFRARHGGHPRAAQVPVDRLITHRTTSRTRSTRPPDLGDAEDRAHQGTHRN